MAPLKKKKQLKVSFTYLKIHPFQVHHSSSFSMCSEWCTHPHNLILECFHHPQICAHNEESLPTLRSAPALQPWATTDLLPLPVDLLLLCWPFGLAPFAERRFTYVASTFHYFYG